MKKSKAIIKSAKKWMPYDYGYTMDLMSTALSEMLRYYEEGNGVMQADESAENIDFFAARKIFFGKNLCNQIEYQQKRERSRTPKRNAA